MNVKLKKTVLAGVFGALTVLATLVIQVPTPTNGYVNAGDAVILLGAFLLGPWYGAAAAGIGSGLADLLSGYVIYAPASLLIKTLMALTAGLLYAGRRKKSARLREEIVSVCSGAAAELIMVAGYFLYEWVLLGSAGAALAGIPANLIQAVFGIAAGVLLWKGVRTVLGDRAVGLSGGTSDKDRER